MRPIAAASLITYVSHGNVDWAVAFFLAIGVLMMIVGVMLFFNLFARLTGYMYRLFPGA